MGTGIVKLAAPLLVLALTESPTLAGLVVGALSFPMVFLGLLAGALVDRWDRRRVMLVCDSIRCLAVTSVPIAWYLDVLSGWWLLVVALALGSAQSFYTLCQVSALPMVVTRRQIPAAQALNSSSESVAQLLSPSLGGLIVAAGPTVIIGCVLAYLVNSFTFLCSVLALIGIRTPFQGRRSRKEQLGLRQSIAQGLRYIIGERSIRLLMIFNGLYRFATSPVMLTIVVLGRDDLGLDPTSIGLIFTVAGGGGLLGAACTPWIRRNVPIGWCTVGVAFVHAASLGVVWLAPSVWLMLPGLFVGSMMEIITGSTQVSYRLALIPDAIQGRVNSVYRLVAFGCTATGTALGGFLIDVYGPRQVIGMIAAWLAVVAAGSAMSGLRALKD